MVLQLQLWYFCSIVLILRSLYPIWTHPELSVGKRPPCFPDICVKSVWVYIVYQVIFFGLGHIFLRQTSPQTLHRCLSKKYWKMFGNLEEHWITCGQHLHSSAYFGVLTALLFRILLLFSLTGTAWDGAQCGAWNQTLCLRDPQENQIIAFIGLGPMTVGTLVATLFLGSSSWFLPRLALGSCLQRFCCQFWFQSPACCSLFIYCFLNSANTSRIPTY